jgi:hypothetical protein
MNTSPRPRPPGRRLSREDRRQLAADLSTKTTAELADRYGVSQRAVQLFAARQRGDEGARITTAVLSVRLEADEMRSIDVLAVRLGMTRAKVARHALRLAAGFFDPDDELVQMGRAIMVELKRIGTNLNQLTYHANRRALLSGRGEISGRDLDTIVGMRDEVAEVARSIGGLIVTKARRRKVMIDQLLREIGS